MGMACLSKGMTFTLVDPSADTCVTARCFTAGHLERFNIVDTWLLVVVVALVRINTVLRCMPIWYGVSMDYYAAAFSITNISSGLKVTLSVLNWQQYCCAIALLTRPCSATCRSSQNHQHVQKGMPSYWHLRSIQAATKMAAVRKSVRKGAAYSSLLYKEHNTACLIGASTQGRCNCPQYPTIGHEA